MKTVTETDINRWYHSSTLTGDDVQLQTGKAWADLTMEDKLKFYKRNSGSPR